MNVVDSDTLRNRTGFSETTEFAREKQTHLDLSEIKLREAARFVQNNGIEK